MTSGRHGLPGRRWSRIGLLALVFGVILAIGVSVMATGTGSEKNRANGVIPTSSGLPSFPLLPSDSSIQPGVATNVPGSTPAHPRPVGTPAQPVAVIVTEGSQPAVTPTQSSTPAQHPTPHRSTTTHHPAPPPSSSSAPPPPPPPSSSEPPPPPPPTTPTPTPTKKCLVPNPLQPGTCLIPMA